MRKKAIIKTLYDAPDVWNASDFERLKSATGADISRDDLKEAREIENSATIQHARRAIDESIERARGADFDTRLKILVNEILPAVEFEQQQEERIRNHNRKHNGAKE